MYFFSCFLFYSCTRNEYCKFHEIPLEIFKVVWQENAQSCEKTRHTNISKMLRGFLFVFGDEHVTLLVVSNIRFGDKIDVAL